MSLECKICNSHSNAICNIRAHKSENVEHIKNKTVYKELIKYFVLLMVLERN